MSKKKLNKKVWYSSEVDVSGNPILPPLADNPEDLEGLHEGELFLHNSDDYPSIWIRTKSGLIKPLIGGQSNTPSYWEVRELPNGDTYLYTSLPIATQSGITMYVNGGNLNLPSIYDGLPIDNNTIYWENGILKAKGGGGVAESVSWADITGKPEWLLDGKISYSEIEGTPDLSVYALKRSLSEYVTKTELSNLDYADKDWVKEYVVDINTGNITAITKQMVIEALGYTPYDDTNPNGYVTSESIPSLAGYATEDWVNKKGYLTSIPSEYITETELAAKGYATALSVNTALGNKVDKIDGKGLSTEDFTTALKTKLESLNNYNDTAISNAVTKLRSDFDALVEGDTSTAIDNFNEIIAFLNGVQDNQDLSSIIASIEQQIAAKYTKPSGGIPKSDLVQAVQTSLGKADSALQSHQSIYTLTFQSGTFASGSFTANSGNKTINIPTTTSHVSEGSNLYFTNARAVSALGDTLKSYVTLSGSQTVSGEKNFTGGLKVNGSPIVYDASKKYWKLEGDLLVTGGVTMYGNDSSFTPSTIMDAIAVDGTTISKEGGVLKVIGGGSGSISEITKQMVIDALGFTPISSSDVPTALPNPHSLKFGSKLYDGSASKTILASDLGITWDDILGRPTLLSSFTDDVVAGKYLPLTGGTIISTGRETLLLRSSNSYGPVLDLQDSKGNIISEIGHIPSNAANYAYGAFWTNIESKVGFVLGNDGIAYVTTNPNTLSPKYTIWHEGNFTPANYLPLSGGTITSSDGVPLNINSTAGYTVIRLQINGISYSVFGADEYWGTYLGVTGKNQKLGIKPDGTPYYNEYSLIHTGNYSSYALPLSGGTINGALSISGAVDMDGILDIGAYIQFTRLADGKTYLFGQPYGVNDPALAFYDGGSWRRIIHSGNIGSQSVSYATSAGNAEKLDGYHATSFGKIVSHTLNAGSILRVDMINQRGLLINIQGTNQERNALYFVTGYQSGTALRNNIRVIKSGPFDVYFNGESEQGCVYIKNNTWTSGKDLLYIHPFGGGDITFENVSAIPSDAVLVSSNDNNTLATLGSNVASATRARYIETQMPQSDDWYTDRYRAYTRWGSDNANILDWRTEGDYPVRVDIAKKLNTARTIWGQSFDGTADVSGNMTNIGSITMNGDILMNNNMGIAIRDTSGEIRFIASILSDNQAYLGNTAINTVLRGASTNITYGNSKTSGIYLNSEGNVGIGTTNPSAKLDVHGQIAINGLPTVYSNGVSTFYAGNKAVTSYFGGNNVHLRYGASETTGLILNSEGNVGIGTTSPEAKLHIVGKLMFTDWDADGTFLRIHNANKGKAFISIYSAYGNAYVFGQDGSRFLISHNNYGDIFNILNGNVGIGITEPSQKLHVDGNILTTGGVTMYSMRKLKNVVDERGLSLDELRTVKPTRYTWKDGRDDRIHIGGIADDIQQVLPEVVYNANGVLTMDYGNAGFAIASSLIKPVIDHEQRIKALEKENEELKQEIKRLKA